MKIVDCIQNSTEWLTARQGIPTASMFKQIFTPEGAVRKGEMPQTYMATLAMERVMRLTIGDGYCSQYMEYGHDTEPKARAWYEFTSGNDVQEVGFITDDSGKWGCSPDGITATGGLEIKCLQPAKHGRTLISGKVPKDFIVQIQACMWITARASWDFCMYVPGYNEHLSIIWPVKADPKMHAGFTIELPAFCEQLDAAEKTLRERYET